MEERHGCLSASHTDWVNSPSGGAHLISLSLPRSHPTPLSPTASSLFIYESIFSAMTRIQMGGRRRRWWRRRRRLRNRRGRWEGEKRCAREPDSRQSAGKSQRAREPPGRKKKKKKRSEIRGASAMQTRDKQIHSYRPVLMRGAVRVHCARAPTDLFVNTKQGSRLIIKSVSRSSPR